MENDDVLLLQVECSLYFQHRPWVAETVSSLSRQIGKPEYALMPVLERLVELSILRQVEGWGGAMLYDYRPPRTARLV